MKYSVSHLYLLTRFSNYAFGFTNLSQFHTFIYLQGSQTLYSTCVPPFPFHTFIYLQGSQTEMPLGPPCAVFHTFIYLQGSQTPYRRWNTWNRFHTFIYLQGSQTLSAIQSCNICFTPLFTYKVLKH